MGYSVDLRERIVEAVMERHLSIREAASSFRVGHATVERYLRRFREHGELTPCKPSGRPIRVNGEQLGALKKQLDYAVVTGNMASACGMSCRAQSLKTNNNPATKTSRHGLSLRYSK